MKLRDDHYRRAIERILAAKTRGEARAVLAALEPGLQTAAIAEQTWGFVQALPGEPGPPITDSAGGGYGDRA